MSRPRQYRWNSFRNLKTLGTNEKLPLPQLLFQAVQVNLNVPGDRMAWRQIFRLDLRPATGTINFHNPHPERVRRKIEFTGNQRRMNFPRIAIIEQAPFLVVLPRRTNCVPAAVTQPALLLNIQVQIFRDPYAALLGGCHGVPPVSVPRYCQFFSSNACSVSRFQTGRARASSLREQDKCCSLLRAPHNHPRDSPARATPSSKAALGPSNFPRRRFSFL